MNLNRVILLLLFVPLLVKVADAQDIVPINGLREPLVDKVTEQEDNSFVPAEPSIFENRQKIIFVPVIYRGSIQDAVDPMENLRAAIAKADRDANSRQIPNPAVTHPTGVIQQTAWVDASADPLIEEQDNASTPAESASEAEPTLSELVATKLEAVKSDSQLDETVKSEKLQLLNKAQDWLQKRQRFVANVKDYKASIAGFEESRQQAQEFLRQLQDEMKQPVKIDPNQTTEQLQSELQRIQSELDSKKSEIETLENSAHHYTKRVTEVPKQKSDAQERLRKVHESLGTADNENTGSSDEADFLQRAIRNGTQAEIEMLNIETHHLEVAAQLNQLQNEVANRERESLQRLFKRLELAVQEARQREVEKQISLARQAAMDAHPSLAEMANRNQELASLRKEIADRIVGLSEESSNVTKQSDTVESDLAALRKLIDQGLNQGTTLLLAESRRQLISPLESRIRLAQIKSELDQVKSMKLQFLDEKEELSDPATFLDQKMEIDVEDKHLQTMAMEFIESRRDLIDNLLTDYRSCGRLLVGITVKHEKLVDGIRDTEELLRRHMVLVRSTQPIQLSTLKRCSTGAANFFSGNQWSTVYQHWSERARKRPYAYLMFGIGFVLLSIVVKRLKG